MPSMRFLEQKKLGAGESWAHVMGLLHARHLGSKSRHEAAIANKLCMSNQQIVPNNIQSIRQ